MSASSESLQPEHWLHDLRVDEDAVRLLKVEGSKALRAIRRHRRAGAAPVLCRIQRD